MLRIKLFVLGAPGYGQFVATASQGRTPPDEARDTQIFAWSRLMLEVEGKSMYVDLLDGAGWDYRRFGSNAFSEILFEGMLGFIVIVDDSPEAQRLREFVRAYAPTPHVVVDARSTDLTSLETVFRITGTVLKEMFEELYDDFLPGVSDDA